MTWAQTADIQHDAFALQAWFVFGDNRIVFGLIFGDNFFGACLNRFIKQCRQFLRNDSAILVGPKKLYSIQGILYFSSMCRAM